MKRPALPFRRALLLCALLTLATAVVAAPTKNPPAPKAPVKLTPENFTSPKLRGWLNGIPDTGQFLPDSVVLMRVGDRVTRVGDYVREYFKSYPEYRPGQDSVGRVTFLNTLRNRDVLGQSALALNLPLGFEDRLALREERQRVLTTAVYQRLVADSVTVSEEEVRDFFNAYQYALKLRHILVPDRNAAELVRREIISGRITWAAAVRKYSIAKGDAGLNGEIGWVTPDKMNPDVVYQTYRIKLGETSQPIQDVQGYHIVQCTERRPNLVPDYSILGKQIRSMIRVHRQSERSEALMATIRLKHGVQYDTTLAEMASTQFVQTTNMKQTAFNTTMEIDAKVPEFAPADTGRAIARWNNGGRFTINDLVHAFSDIPPLMRPALTRKELILAFVESVALEPFIAAHGASVGLEKDPLVTVPMARKLEELMVSRMYGDSIASRVYVSRDERMAYYEKNKPQYFTYPSVEYASFWKSTKAGTDSLVALLQSGRDPRAILAADSAAGLISGSIKHLRFDEGGPHHKPLFEEMRPGDVQWRGPDKQGDYLILKLLTFDGGRQLSYTESEPMIAESLQNIREDEALRALVERLSRRYTIEMHPELLGDIKMLDPTIE
jgi:PPIC-type PPIASE domain